MTHRLNGSDDDIMDFEKSGRKREEPLLEQLSLKRAKEVPHWRTAATSDFNEDADDLLMLAAFFGEAAASNGKFTREHHVICDHLLRIKYVLEKYERYLTKIEAGVFKIKGTDWTVHFHEWPIVDQPERTAFVVKQMLSLTCDSPDLNDADFMKQCENEWERLRKEIVSTELVPLADLDFLLLTASMHNVSPEIVLKLKASCAVLQVGGNRSVNAQGKKSKDAAADDELAVYEAYEKLRANCFKTDGTTCLFELPPAPDGEDGEPGLTKQCRTLHKWVKAMVAMGKRDLSLAIAHTFVRALVSRMINVRTAGLRTRVNLSNWLSALDALNEMQCPTTISVDDKVYDFVTDGLFDASRLTDFARSIVEQLQLPEGHENPVPARSASVAIQCDIVVTSSLDGEPLNIGKMLCAYHEECRTAADGWPMRKEMSAVCGSVLASLLVLGNVFGAVGKGPGKQIYLDPTKADEAYNAVIAGCVNACGEGSALLTLIANYDGVAGWIINRYMRRALVKPNVIPFSLVEGLSIRFGPKSVEILRQKQEIVDEFWKDEDAVVTYLSEFVDPDAA